jgi:Conjugal transfer protein
MRHLKFVVNCALVFSSIGAFAQDSARTVQYHSQDIIPIRAKVKYTTLIELPTTEKIMEAATGDKEFWIVDVVGNFCFVHPAKQGISSNLNLITDKGNIYSFTLQDISGPNSTAPDLKVIVEPADRSAIVVALTASGKHSNRRRHCCSVSPSPRISSFHLWRPVSHGMVIATELRVGANTDEVEDVSSGIAPMYFLLHSQV